MFLVVLLSVNSSENSISSSINNLCIFLNAFLLSSPNNRVKIINSKRVLYDSQFHLKFPLEYFRSRNDIEIVESRIENDLGYSLMGHYQDDHIYTTNTLLDDGYDLNNAPVDGDYSSAGPVNSAPVNDTPVNSPQVNSPQVNSPQVNSPQVNSSQVNSPQVNIDKVIHDSILIYDLTNNNTGSYLNFIKAMFVAQSNKIKIHAFSKNSFIKMCCSGTNGIFLKESSLNELFTLLGNIPVQKDSYEILCCCNDHSKVDDKVVRIGLVCPICLSVFCKFKPICSKCKTKFNFIK